MKQTNCVLVKLGVVFKNEIEDQFVVPFQATGCIEPTSLVSAVSISRHGCIWRRFSKYLFFKSYITYNYSEMQVLSSDRKRRLHTEDHGWNYFIFFV